MTIDRRGFLRVSGLTAGVAVATACGAATQAPPAATSAPAEATAAPAGPTAAPAEGAAPASKFTEAPSLAEKVAAGDLPAVEERLPAEPLIVECIEEIGQYSDDMHMVARPGTTYMAFYNREGLTRWDFTSGAIEIAPNVASGWDISDDATSYTFHLRPGMRWSDGEPFTADDIMFWYEDIASNNELSPAFPGWLVVGGEPVVVEKVDDYTVTFKFAAPYGIFLEAMSFRGAASPTFAPKHYLTQFHPNYTDLADVEKLAEDANFETWYQFFASKSSWASNGELPTIWPWVPTSDAGLEQTTAVRNPYYFKVDTEGKQLPYFERFIVTAAQNSELTLMKAIAGEIDFQAIYMQFSDYAVLKENEEQGDYTIIDWLIALPPCVNVNQSVQDPGLRELFRNAEFRHALSHGINRDESNDLFWHSLAKPENPTPNPLDVYYKPDAGWGTTALEYDPDKANSMLDAIGLDKRDGDGWRLRADGNRLQLVLETFPTSEASAPAIDIFEQVASYWRELGIDAQSREIESSLWVQRANGNEMDLPSYVTATLLWVVDPGWFVPSSHCYWAPAFAQWVTSGGSGGEEPNAEIMQLIDWYEELKEEPDAARRIELGQMIGQQHHEQTYMIGVATPSINPVMVKNGIVNVLKNGIADYRVLREDLSWPFQIWRRQA